MPDTGYKSAGGGLDQVRSGSGASWLYPGNIISSNDMDASSLLPKLTYSDYLRAHSFNCGIPTGATITGIEVKIQRASSKHVAHKDDSVRLYSYGAFYGDDKVETDGSKFEYYLKSDSIATYGGSTDTWGKSNWTPTLINNISVQLSVVNDSCLPHTCFVDHVQIRVWYTVSVVVVPTVTTQAVTNITTTYGLGHGIITNLGGENCTKRGICWNTTGAPTVSNSKSEETGSFTTGSFSRYMTSLSPGTHFYVRAYAYNSAGYGYGNTVQFETTGSTVVAPTVTTQAVTGIGNTIATGNGNITATGGENCTQGICWDTSSDPTVLDDHVENAGTHGIGAFIGNITALTPGAHYYVKAYAWNSAGYSYGTEVEFDATGGGTSCIGDGNYPGLGTEEARGGSSGSWANPDKITAYSYTGPHATWSPDAQSYSPWLKGDNYGFNIPSSATIDGIRIEIERYSTLADKAKDSSLRLAVNGVLKGNDKADTVNYYLSTFSCYRHGSSTDKWGTTWTPNDINNIEVYLSSYKLAGSCTVYVNYVTVRVWYTDDEEKKEAMFFGLCF
jgi:hypothetical protein